jgi:biotin synthase-related radical SAM superfamily protein
MVYDGDGRLVGLEALLPGTGEPFQTSGCPDCNRPFYNEQPGGPLYNYPRPLTAGEVARAIQDMGRDE